MLEFAKSHIVLCLTNRYNEIKRHIALFSKAKTLGLEDISP
jgi:hypothetical protein